MEALPRQQSEESSKRGTSGGVSLPSLRAVRETLEEAPRLVGRSDAGGMGRATLPNPHMQLCVGSYVSCVSFKLCAREATED